MAPDKTIKKRRNKRKSRTEVSSPISSDNESAASTPEPVSEVPQEQPIKKQKKSKSTSTAPARSDEEVASHSIVIPPQEISKNSQDQAHEKAFSDFILRQTTNEFANDLDKLRSAGDFNERSVPMLVRALRQGTACFSVEERVAVGKAVEAHRPVTPTPNLKFSSTIPNPASRSTPQYPIKHASKLLALLFVSLAYAIPQLQEDSAASGDKGHHGCIKAGRRCNANCECCNINCNAGTYCYINGEGDFAVCHTSPQPKAGAGGGGGSGGGGGKGGGGGRA
ncbi:unnamed protein product [Zymoseptoria tritici ST99CH_3D1]|nr:unnamed protein product [Zymoseptoria tritici ST99CH_3D1]